jgi:hypothetical protein
VNNRLDKLKAKTSGRKGTMKAFKARIQFQTIRSRSPIITLASSTLLWVGIMAGYSQGTLYTDRSIFNAALQSSTTIDFENLPAYDGVGIGQSPVTVSLQTPPFTTLLTITNFSQRLFVVGPGAYYPTLGDGQYVWNFDSGTPIGIFFPGGKNAFAADFSGGIQNNPFNATLTFTLLGGQTYTHNFTGQDGQWTFRGFVFSQTITSVIYDDGGQDSPGFHEEMIDNVTYGVAVPEPQILTLALGGIFAAPTTRRRQH